MSNISRVLYRSTRQRYPFAVRGEGMYLYDRDGKAYLDMSGGAAVALLGHQHPHVIALTREQLERLAYAHSAFFTTDAQEELATRLVGRFGDPAARAYFSSGGSEANETAIKMAWQYWRAVGKPDKKVIISRRQSYHGNTFLTLSVSGNVLRREASAAPLIDWPRIAPCYAYRDKPAAEDEQAYGIRMARELAAAIESAGPENVAAFICETVVGASLGAVAAVEGYLQEIRRVCDQYDILLLLDEIMCGSGRCVSYFAFEAEQPRPDLVTLGKGLAAGYQPLAATMVAGRVAGTLYEAGFTHGYTYVSHATACAAACAVQAVYDAERIDTAVRDKGARFLAMLRRHFASHPRVGDVRGRGLLLGIELVSDRETKAGFNDPLADRLRLAAMAEGLICYPGQMLLDDSYVPHILLAPPAIVDESQMAECCAMLDRVFAACVE